MTCAKFPKAPPIAIVLDPNAADAQGPRGAGTKGYGGSPMKAAKSRFIWFAVAATAVVNRVRLYGSPSKAPPARKSFPLNCRTPYLILYFGDKPE